MRFPKPDVSHFPLVRCQYPESFEVEDVDAFIQDLELVYKRGKFGVIVNIDGVKKVTARLRLSVAHGIDTLTTRYSGTVLAEAIVASSVFLRASVTSYSWFRTDKSFPTKCFKNDAEATAWVIDVMARAGLRIPP